MKKIYLSHLMREGYQGSDMNLFTSLFEYGFIWKINKRKKEIRFIFGSAIGDPGEYIGFNYAIYPIDTNPKEEWSWIDFKEVAESSNTNIWDFFRQDFPWIVYDLFLYYGAENIFGSTYSSFEVCYRKGGVY